MKVEQAEEEIRVGGHAEMFRRLGMKIAAISLAAGVITFLVMLRLPNLYEASGTIIPTTEEDKPNISLGLIASSIGLSAGGPTRMEDLEALFRSRELTVRVFKKYNLWPIIEPDAYDAKSGKLRTGFMDRLFLGMEETKDPSDWDAVRAVEKRFRVNVNRKMGTLQLVFESRSAEGSKNAVSQYLEEAKSTLQEISIERANRNKKFLEGQLGRTVDPIIRDRLYSLYSREVEKEMLAKNRDQFGFTILDPPMVPDRKSRPARTLSALVAAIIAGMLSCGVFLLKS